MICLILATQLINTKDGVEVTYVRRAIVERVQAAKAVNITSCLMTPNLDLAMVVLVVQTRGLTYFGINPY